MFVLPVRIILLDTRAERSGSDSVTDASPAASVLRRELAAEQAHVDLVYARLGEATQSAQQVARAGLSLYQSDRNSYVREEDGTGLYERDVFALPGRSTAGCAGCRAGGLVFGRLDRTDGEVRYVRRIGVRDADYEPLVIDWRAPAAEPFYRATPNDPMHIIRRPGAALPRRTGGGDRRRPSRR